MSPATAVILGWSVLGQKPGALQLLGLAIVLAGAWASQWIGAQELKSAPAPETWRPQLCSCL